MSFRTLLLASFAAGLVGCGQAPSADSSASTGAAHETASAQQAAEALESTAKSGVYTPDERHRYITFSYFHQGYSHPWVRWRNWTGELNWDGEAPENSSVSITIDAASVDSGVDVFDGHLNGERFFDTANNPEITFVSTNVEKTGATTGKITGDLTIKGITKPVTLDAVFNKGEFNAERNSSKLGFSATVIVNRSEFGLDFLVPSVGDEVSIVIETEWVMSAPASE
ncbi:YceI family protein [Hyphococcus sp.]|uniref:YceI family protein n=1 Tax=Hyphococcus sp. TaxID=2038636 RepID=UPI00208290AB|nr:MAG: hypothetical protein DHS20C04_14870 [Marinicaulis sp.]